MSDNKETTHKATSETIQDSEPGRKYESTKEEHLRHLLNIGWAVDSPLIQKYVTKNNLWQELKEYVG